MINVCLDHIAQQLAEKDDELRCGTAPAEIEGSTTVRVATGLIAGIHLKNTIFTDEGSWSLLDEVERRTSVWVLQDFDSALAHMGIKP